MPIPTTTVSISRIWAIAATRLALGAGIGLLVADRLEPSKRRVAGGVLVTLGVVSTAPLVVPIVKGIQQPDSAQA